MSLFFMITVLYLVLFALLKILMVLQNICQQEAISSANNFFHPTKFCQLSPNFKDAIENIWRPTIVLLGDKILCSLIAILCGSSYFVNMTN